MSAQKSSAADGFVIQMGWRPGCKHYDKVRTQMVCCVATIQGTFCDAELCSVTLGGSAISTESCILVVFMLENINDENF